MKKHSQEDEALRELRAQEFGDTVLRLSVWAAFFLWLFWLA